MRETKLPRELEDALRDGDIEGAKRLFSLCEPNAVQIHSNVFSLTPMPKEFALWAKERGADVNFRNEYGQTPLFDIVRMDADAALLIQLGADVNAVRNDGYTPLHCAVSRGRKKAARTLLKAGADMEARTKGHDGRGAFTPLEMTLIEPDLSSIRKLDICRFLIDKGANMTERSRLLASAFSTAFYRHNGKKKPSPSLVKQEAALQELCVLFDAPVIREASFHDGVSPVLVTNVPGFKDNFRELWSFLVPPRGRAQTAQGEVIRIAGRIQDELMRNGGMNWDDDYRKMLYTFRAYMYMDDPDGGQPDSRIEEIAEGLKNGDVRDGLIWWICNYCALHWVEDHPEVMPPLEADYTR